MPESKSSKPPLLQRLQKLIAEYGQIALWAYFGLFAIVLLAFALAFQLGFRTASTSGAVGIWGAAYLATKLTQPFRIAATLALTPFVVKLVRRGRPPSEAA